MWEPSCIDHTLISLDSDVYSRAQSAENSIPVQKSVNFSIRCTATRLRRSQTIRTPGMSWYTCDFSGQVIDAFQRCANRTIFLVLSPRTLSLKKNNRV